MLRAHIMILEASLVRAEPESRGISKVLCPVKVTGFVEDCWGSILGVLFERWEATRFAESELLLRD